LVAAATPAAIRLPVNNLTASTAGYAAGMDRHLSPDTVVGFALAGGGTNWGLANSLGTGRSDAFQVGVYGVTRAGPAYLGGAIAFANHWFTTNRTAVGDQLTANFVGQSYAARVEGGYRYAVLPTLGVTPYAAVQAQDFSTPRFSETDVTGGGAGLSFAAQNATDVRSELGARLDNPTAIGRMPLILRARLAWAHDFVNNPALAAAFQVLPGSNSSSTAHRFRTTRHLPPPVPSFSLLRIGRCLRNSTANLLAARRPTLAVGHCATRGSRKRRESGLRRAHRTANSGAKPNSNR
jgi:outer membrane autotransporter protein